MRKQSKEHPPPFWQTCKVLRPWALFRETTVINIQGSLHCKQGYRKHHFTTSCGIESTTSCLCMDNNTHNYYRSNGEVENTCTYTFINSRLLKVEHLSRTWTLITRVGLLQSWIPVASWRKVEWHTAWLSWHSVASMEERRWQLCSWKKEQVMVFVILLC